MTKEQIRESIEKMTVLELSELVKAIETKFDFIIAGFNVSRFGILRVPRS